MKKAVLTITQWLTLRLSAEALRKDRRIVLNCKGWSALYHYPRIFLFTIQEYFERFLVVNRTIFRLLLTSLYVLEDVPRNLFAAEISDTHGRPQNASFLNKIHRDS